MNGVLGGNTTVGTISSGGLYTAPASVPLPATVNITATSAADPTKSASATVTIGAAVSVSVSPTTASVQVSATQSFTPTVTGSTNTNVTWSVNGVAGNATVGTISSGGLYTAQWQADFNNLASVISNIADSQDFNILFTGDAIARGR